MKIILAVLLFVVVHGYAQRSKLAYAELGWGGNSEVMISGNFDMRFKKNQNDGFGFRAGLGGAISNVSTTQFSSRPYNNQYILSDDTGKELGFVFTPVTLNYITGRKNNYFEAGIGAMAFFLVKEVPVMSLSKETKSGVVGFLDVGYRYQPIYEGVTLGLKWSPMFNSNGFYPQHFSIAFGYSFK